MTQEDRITSDSESCTGCGQCVEICPHRALQLQNGEISHSIEECFFCGHCAAVCPEEALQISGRSFRLGLVHIEESSTPLRPGEKGKQFLQLTQSRRSCRNYKTEPVPISMLEDLVKIGTTAPSGTNSQTWQFTILPGRKEVVTLGELVGDYYQKLNKLAEKTLLRRLLKFLGQPSLQNYYQNYYSSIKSGLEEWREDKVDRLFHGAPAAIVVSAEKASSCPAEDALLASQNIILAAHTLGLGSCLIGFAVEAMRREPRINRRLGVNPNEEVYSVIALGFPGVRFLRPAARKKVVPRVFRVNS